MFKDNGDFNDKLTQTIKDSLGPSSEEIIAERDESISKSSEEITALDDKLSRTSDPEERAEINQRIKVKMDVREALEQEREEIEERMSLRDRIKMIFKKYGLTAFGIITAVGTVIGVIVSNLKSGLAKVAKGLGDGLKELGKKLAQLLPGMIGAIAKYIFNAAGEVVGYLAKNTWLLIVAAVIYAVEQFKKKNK